MNNELQSPSLSRTALNSVGDIIRARENDHTYDNAIRVLNQWREAHVISMDYYFDQCVTLSRKFKYRNTVVAQRLKRLPTIIDKLNRFPKMRISSMQDIGGVRVILTSFKLLEKFQKELGNLPALKSTKDYIYHPKESGYRGRHLIFKYRDDMLTEVQLRTRLQHLWATSVETIDVIQLQLKLRHLMVEYSIQESLEMYAATHSILNDSTLKKDDYYAVMTFDEQNNTTRVVYYAENQYEMAFSDYARREKSSISNSVLVSVDNLAKLQEAYPNYFKNISNFVDVILLMLAFDP